MGLLKSLFGFGGVERVGDRLLEEAAQAKARGEDQVWLSYTQQEIGIRGNAAQMGVFIRRKLEKAGYSVVDAEATGSFGDDVRLLIRVA